MVQDLNLINFIIASIYLFIFIKVWEFEKTRSVLRKKNFNLI